MAISVAVAVLIAACHWLCNTTAASALWARLASALRPAAAHFAKPGSEGGGRPRLMAFGCVWCGAPAQRAQRAQHARPTGSDGWAPSWLKGSSSSAAKLELESSAELGAAPAGGTSLSATGEAALKDSANLHASLPSGKINGRAAPDAGETSGHQQAPEGPDVHELLAAVRHMERLLLVRRSQSGRAGHAVQA